MTTNTNLTGLNFKVTYFDQLGMKRVRVVLGAAGAGPAMDWVEQLHNPSRVVAAIRLDEAALQALLLQGRWTC